MKVGDCYWCYGEEHKNDGEGHEHVHDHVNMMIFSLNDVYGEKPCWPRIQGFGSVPWSPPKNNHNSQFTLYGWKPRFTEQYTM